MAPRCIEIPKLVDEFFNPNVQLPYNLTRPDIRIAMEAVYQTLNDINRIVFERSSRRLEDTLLGNSLSGVISELLVQAIATTSPSLLRNDMVGGHPDLLPIGYYDSTEVQHGDAGIEVKSSIQNTGWQGHNPEDGWFMVFRYIVDTTTLPINDRYPSRFVQILIAELTKDDWSFSGRKGDSRRTPTASILKSGLHKLRSNPVYQEPDAVVWPRKYSYQALYGSSQIEFVLPNKGSDDKS